MTDNTQELDEIFNDDYFDVKVAKQAILDWHNKQTESLYELLDEVVEPMDDDCSYDHHGYCQSHFLHDNPCPYARAKALVAERNKLKESSDEHTR